MERAQEKPNEVYIKVARKETCLDESCFDLDFRDDTHLFGFCWNLVPNLLAEKYREDEDWICFSGIDINYVTVRREKSEEEKTLSERSVEELQKLLTKSLEKEDYEKASNIRSEIEKRRRDG